MKILCITILVLTAAFSAFAQTRTVTNQDLEKFRRERLAGERQLRENYAQLGFPSPEEIERRQAQRDAELAKYADQIRREKALTQYGNNVAPQTVLPPQFVPNYNGFYYVYSYIPYNDGRKRAPLRQLRNLPPNMRTVQEYASMYPGTQRFMTQPNGRIRFGNNGFTLRFNTPRFNPPPKRF